LLCNLSTFVNASEATAKLVEFGILHLRGFFLRSVMGEGEQFDGNFKSKASASGEEVSFCGHFREWSRGLVESFQGRWIM